MHLPTTTHQHAVSSYKWIFYLFIYALGKPALKAYRQQVPMTMEAYIQITETLYRYSCWTLSIDTFSTSMAMRAVKTIPATKLNLGIIFPT